MNKKYNKFIDILRILLCIAVFLYHLGILKGGYLAVCGFFSLSGFLTCLSFHKKDDIDLKEYYESRLVRLYLPLVCVVLVTLAIVSFVPDIIWVSLKPETRSVFLGYNNFWQINANLDYFARHVDSPFMHLWYIAILMQFELLFPFIYKAIKVISKNKSFIKIIVSGLLTVLSMGVYVFCSKKLALTIAYYNTFTRIFSLFMGAFFGYISVALPKFEIKKNAVFYSLIAILTTLLIIMFIFVKPDSILNVYGMIGSSLITCLILLLSIFIEQRDKSYDSVIKKMSEPTYLVYLVQYPVIFLFQYVDIPQIVLKDIIIFVVTILISLILNYSLSIFKKKDGLRIVISSLVLLLCLYGLYQYSITEDHTEEMNQLEQQLAANEEDMLRQQEEYAKQLEEENKNLEEMLAELENNEASLKDMVKKLPMVSIGDSVMLGASDKLYKTFPNLYCDAKVSRTAWVADGILQKLKDQKLLANTVIIHLGTNGDCSQAQKKKIMQICKDCDVFWVSVTNDKDVNVNKDLLKIVEKYDNAYYIDWKEASKGHADYFISDGIHLTPKGKSNYAKTILNGIYEVYLERLNQQKQELIDNRNAQLDKKISFYGNDLLTNIFEDLSTDYPDARFIAKDFNGDNLLESINSDINDNLINKKVTLLFDSSLALETQQLKNMIEALGDREIYLFSTRNDDKLSIVDSYQNVKFINLSDELSNDDCWMPDKVHLSEKGNDILVSAIEELLGE